MFRQCMNESYIFLFFARSRISTTQKDGGNRSARPEPCPGFRSGFHRSISVPTSGNQVPHSRKLRTNL